MINHSIPALNAADSIVPPQLHYAGEPQLYRLVLHSTIVIGWGWISEWRSISEPERALERLPAALLLLLCLSAAACRQSFARLVCAVCTPAAAGCLSWRLKLLLVTLIVITNNKPFSQCKNMFISIIRHSEIPEASPTDTFIYIGIPFKTNLMFFYFIVVVVVNSMRNFYHITAYCVRRSCLFELAHEKAITYPITELASVRQPPTTHYTNPPISSMSKNN